ncbi:non-ribosomal peptide synthetase [Rhizohabitans arisaemae]|uniref:non-ribosomal peptide synthetase n=1 Tax=Rhizohabitans arisaemae TaxID=2720610 RepID=UPI0024B276DD|nr:non-ribosomal peptide synthetase [Rhizohabitans arisaemae]
MTVIDVVPHAWTEGPSREAPDALLTDLVTAQAARTPDAPAIRQWDTVLSYRELIGTAAELARRLTDLGVGPETKVGLCARRTPWLTASALGIMLAGGAYVPLDPGHPRGRLDDVLDDAGIRIVVADRHGRELLHGTDRTLVDTPAAVGTATPGPGRALPGGAAYVLYTSGSTGRPKGVTVNHSSVAAFATASAAHHALDETCRSIAFSALGFDVSVLDMLTPLTCGGSVQLIPDDDRVDPARLQRFLEAHEVTWGFIPPALLPLLDPSRLTRLRDLITAGEPPGPEQVARWSAHCRFHNWYGPTETTVCVVGTELTGTWTRPLPIGRPLAGCQAYILDERMNPCPPGVPGELHIGGPQVARGYLGRPALTAERFVPDPFSDVPGARLYRTGDHVVWEPDGGIAFMGRLDRQVKIQGQRVEIGEVESVLRAHPGVLQCVVDGVGELIAYVAPGDAPDLAGLRDHAAQRLPRYMLPTGVVHLDSLPLNSSGKVDMAALRALGPVRDHATGRPGRVPVTPVQQAVAAIWARVLDTPDPSLDDDFLASGGHSLRAMRLVSAIRAELGRQVCVEDVYEGRTCGGLAHRVETAEEADESAPLGGNAPELSPGQRRLWFVERLAPESPAHNIAMAERIRGPLDAGALRSALGAVVARHEVLRWRISHPTGVPKVSVAPPGPVPLPLVDLTTLPSPDREDKLAEVLDGEAKDRFDLARGPLIRARLIRLAPDDHVFAVTVHHIVFDGWSQDVLYRDIAQAYSGGSAAPAGLAFADYVAWLRERDIRRSAEHLTWWRGHLAGAPTVLDLPRDAPRPPVQSFHGAVRHAAIGPELGGAVRGLAARLTATPYSVLLAGFAELLHRLTGRHDLIIGTPFADRRHVAFEQLIGMCLQILPLRISAAGEGSFAERVRACQEELTQAMAHCDVPLERIVDSLGVARDLSRTPVTQVMFNMYNFAEPRLNLPGCTAEPLPAGLPGSLFDLTLYVSEQAAGYVLQLVHNPALFTAERMDALLESYVGLLTDLTAAPDAPVSAASARGGRDDLPAFDDPLPEWAGPGVVAGFTAAATAEPDRIAVTGPGGDLTYRELDALRRRTARAVTGAGIAPGETVAILARRETTLPALMLGVLTPGTHWAVLDPAHPPALLARQAAAARARALLAVPGAEVPAELAHLPSLDLPGSADGPEPEPAERGYLSFTSGTTGDPKPVRTSEGPLAHFVAWYAETFEITSVDRFAFLSGLAHDPALRDVFVPLLTGARLHVPDQALVRDPGRLAAWLRQEAITVLHLTPQLARLLTGKGQTAPLPGVRLVAIGGDRLTEADVARLRRLMPGARIVAFYGTTETPQAHAWHEPGAAAAESGEPIPAGRGVDGSRLVVVGAGGRPAGVGELGEVVIHSRHLADGYLDPELTGLRFEGAPGGARIFRTGDVGRYRPDGAVVLAGRADDQIKIRGFRVELGEVEAAVAAHPGVRTAAAAATATGESAERVVIAYAVPSRPGLLSRHILDHLRATLPEYAVPADVLLLPALPLTPNGKVDRAALPRPTLRPPADAAEAPTGRTEIAVAEAWRAVLGLPRIRPTDNFFEIGGHSLAIISVQSRLTEFLGREIPVVDLFRHPTIRTLAGYLDGAASSPGLDRAARRLAVRRDRLRKTGPRQAEPRLSQEGNHP